MARLFYYLLVRLVGALALLAPLSAIAGEILVVYSADNISHQQLVDALEKDLGASVRIVRYPLRNDMQGQFISLPSAACDLVITVGVNTTVSYLTARYTVPLLAVLIPRVTYHGLLELRPPGLKLSAVFVDQPLSRQVGLIRIIMPRVQRVGLVYGTAGAGAVTELQQLLLAKGMELVSQPAWRDTSLYPALQTVFQSADVLLALPDPGVINAGTSQNLLLTSFRFRKPVIGYSASYVRAGALASVYSSPAQIGDTVAQRVRETLLRGNFQQDAFYPRDYSIAINRGLAANLGLQIPDDGQVLDLLRKAESRP